MYSQACKSLTSELNYIIREKYHFETAVQYVIVLNALTIVFFIEKICKLDVIYHLSVFVADVRSEMIFREWLNSRAIKSITILYYKFF